MTIKRSSGILLPIFSLPSKHGIGNLGREAYNFIDFLEEAGQVHWQILPLGPTGFGDSPYQSFSTFAGNPYLIDLEGLVEEGWISLGEIEAIDWGTDPEKIDYGLLYENREKVLRQAFKAFDQGLNSQESQADDYLEFCMANKEWLEDYALFMALKKHANMEAWYDWQDEDIRTRKAQAVKDYRALLSEEIKYQRFLQFIFFSQWEKLRNYAHIKGVKIIGDLPIYISMDSADAWVNTKLMKFNDKQEPIWVAGVPPDYFAEKGQLWGNPIYDWGKMKRDGYSWWMKRLAAAGEMFDLLRLDHFRGFESYWQVPYGKTDAIQGEWVKGPGWHFLKRVKKNFPDLEIIAEDLGDLNPQVHKLLDKTGFPGMKVLQFAFAGDWNSEHLPHSHKENSVVYTGTHDNNTSKGWLDEDATDEEKTRLVKYLGLEKLTNDERWSHRLVRSALGSVANLAIVPLQDYLDKSADGRINTPSTLGGNWQWRLTKKDLSPELASEIRSLTTIYGRLV